MTETTTPAEAPDTIRWSYLALLTAAAFSIIAPLVLLTQRSYLESSQRDTDKKAKPQVHRTAQDLHNLITDTMRLQLILGVIVAALLVWLAMNLRRGSYRARWILYAVYVLLALGRLSLVSFFSIVTVFSSAPVLLKLVTFIGGVALLAAVILSSLPASSQYVNRNRAPRPARGAARGGTVNGARPNGAASGARPGLFATLFAPRPPTSTPASGSASKSVSGPASTRSSGEPMRRGKAKARSAPDTSADSTTSLKKPAPPSLKKQAKAKGR